MSTVIKLTMSWELTAVAALDGLTEFAHKLFGYGFEPWCDRPPLIKNICENDSSSNAGNGIHNVDHVQLQVSDIKIHPQVNSQCETH